MDAIRFMVIASGQVFTKYWLPAHNNKDVVVSGVITLEAPSLTDIPAYLTDSEEKTITLLTEHSSDYSAIALLVPSDARLSLLKKIVNAPSLTDKKIFIEKPFTRSLEELNEYIELIKTHSSRLHFAGKYAYGRADTLINKLLEFKEYPIFINATMIEGTQYFSKVSQNDSSNLYVKDGPELDIGFHMLNIVTEYLHRKNVKILEISVNDKSVKDITFVRPYFLPKYGFTAEVTFKLENGIQIPLYLQVGKADCVSERHIDFDFHSRRLIQHYTVTNAKDPVYMYEEDLVTFISEHSADYLYYSQEIKPQLFCKQSVQEQINSIDINRVCLEIKHNREYQDLKQ